MSKRHERHKALTLDYRFFQLPSSLWRAAIDLRFEVFVAEQKVPPEMEIDEYDETAQHLLVRDENQVAVGTLRILLKDGEGKIGRVAVAAAHRHRGIGTHMMRLALEHCRSLGLAAVALDAQTYIVPFYQHLGFVREGETFMDAGIPHVHMRLALRDRGRDTP